MFYSDTRSFAHLFRNLLNVYISNLIFLQISHDSLQLSIAFLRLVALARGLE